MHTILFVTTLVLLNGQVQTQQTTLDYENMQECVDGKLQMQKSLDTLKHDKDLYGFSLECKGA